MNKITVNGNALDKEIYRRIPMSVYKVDICGVTTSKLPVLKDDEKEELFEKIKKEIRLQEKYIRGNLRLVLSVIRRFSNHNENMDDLFQIGCIGLMKSIDNFDPTIGVKFSTYAVPMIIGEVRRYLRDNSAYRIPRSSGIQPIRLLNQRKSYRESWCMIRL